MNKQGSYGQHLIMATYDNNNNTSCALSTMDSCNPCSTELLNIQFNIIDALAIRIWEQSHLTTYDSNMPLHHSCMSSKGFKEMCLSIYLVKQNQNSQTIQGILVFLPEVKFLVSPTKFHNRAILNAEQIWKAIQTSN